MSAARLSFILLLGFSVSARADWSSSLDQYFSAEDEQMSHSVANPQNQILQFPDVVLEDDLRPEIKMTGEASRLVLRPRLIAQEAWWAAGSSEQTQNAQGSVNFTDAYGELRLSDSLRATAGLEVYQWGPAEIFNASNPLFHLNTESRSAFFKEKGAALIRLAWDTNENWNNMLILNPVSNNEPDWRANQTFYPSGFLKSELRTSGGQTYAGFLAGNQSDGRDFVGEYAAVALDSGFSFYVDARHPIGQRSYRPVTIAPGLVQMTDVEGNSGFETLGIVGIRYEGRFDVRAEYFYNSEGYNPSEFALTLQSMQGLSPFLSSNYFYFWRSGLELFGTQYGYLSLRIPDLGRKKDATAFVREFFSIQDRSSVLQVAFDQPLSDSVVLDLEGNLFSGDDNQELTLAQRTLWLIGAHWTL